MADKKKKKNGEDEKAQGAKGGQMKENTTGGTVSQGPTVGKGGASAKKAEAEDELGLEPKVVKDSLLHGPDYDEVEEL